MSITSCTAWVLQKQAHITKELSLGGNHKAHAFASVNKIICNSPIREAQKSHSSSSTILMMHKSIIMPLQHEQPLNKTS
uniref:Uncharacterized protein n=1 Tax=Rhizophora mucronata TaxID=61149 RepID=A0A2P2PYZ3_RHIMU